MKVSGKNFSGLRKKSFRGVRFKNQGIMLLEVLISILLFALGIVALVAMQGRSLVATDDVQYRAEAMHFANAYIGKMWAATTAGNADGTGGITGAQLHARFSSADGGGEYAAFSNLVRGENGIPGALAPVVTVVDQRRNFSDPRTGQTVTVQSVDVTVTILWNGRDARDGAFPHNYTQVTSIGF